MCSAKKISNYDKFKIVLIASTPLFFPGTDLVFSERRELKTGMSLIEIKFV